MRGVGLQLQQDMESRGWSFQEGERYCFKHDGEYEFGIKPSSGSFDVVAYYLFAGPTYAAPTQTFSSFNEAYEYSRKLERTMLDQ